MEIERKFKCQRLNDLEKFYHKEIEQSYLSFEPEVRLRKINNQEFYLTSKSAGELVREEREVAIEEEVYNILQKLVISPIIKKTRYCIPLNNGLTAEMDIYHLQHEGLITVEVEFKSLEEAQEFIVPDWFLEEITKDANYKNKNLARVRKNG